MIINIEREPNLSLYYLGSVLLSILENDPIIGIETLLMKSKCKIKEKIHIDFWYYALDWLFLLSLIEINEGKVYYANRQIDSTQNKPL